MPVIAQVSTDAPEPATKDPQGIAVVQQAISAMAGTTLAQGNLDSVSTGTLLIGGSSPAAFPITIKTKGTRKVRSELERPNGKGVRILNDGRAAIVRADGKIRRLSRVNTVAERVTHIPLLSLLAEFQDADVEVKADAATMSDARPVAVVTLSLVAVDKNDPVENPREVTLTTFLIDASTGFVAEVRYTSHAENNPLDKRPVVIRYSDYRQVSGIWVPFRQTTYLDGKLESELVLGSVSFGVGLSDSEFELPEPEVANAQ
ncbi:MAG: hypothetical protein ACRD2Q_01775 [Terriglobales bacterium]